MNIKRACLVAAGVLVAGFVYVYASFQNEMQEKGAPVETEETTVLRVLTAADLRQTREVYDALAAGFEAVHPEIHVEMNYVDQENLKKEVLLTYDSELAPDLLICNGIELAALTNMNVLQDLTEQITPELRNNLIYQELWNSARRNAGCYGIPFTCDPYVLFVNSWYLEEFGLPCPTDWNSFYAVCDRMKAEGLYGVCYAAGGSLDSASLFNHLLYSCGGNYYNLSGTPGQRSLEILDLIKRRGYASREDVNYRQSDALRMFSEGQSAMLLAPLSSRAWLDVSSEMRYQVTLVPQEQRQTAVVEGDFVSMFRDAAPEAAAFLAYLYEPSSREMLLEAGVTLPAFWDEEEMTEQTSIIAIEAVLQDSGTVFANYGGWYEICDILAEYTRNALIKRNVDIAQMAVSLQDEVSLAIVND